MEERAARPGLREAVAVWALIAVVGLAVLVTYSRIPPEELYHVDETGIAGGLGRFVVFLNWPSALIAIALALVVIDRLAEQRYDVVGFAAAVLCAAVAVPGVVDQADLDVRLVNAIPAAGVALVAALTVLALRRGGLGVRVERTGWDLARIALAIVLVIAALPWLFAEIGVYVGDVPGLGSLFMSDEIYPEKDDPMLRAVHLGEHHGTDGVFFALTALVLSRELPWMKRRPVRVGLAAYLALALAYGVANAFQDFWNEQLMKRGTTDLSIPSVLRPTLSVGWGVVLSATVLLYVFVFRPLARPRAA